MPQQEQQFKYVRLPNGAYGKFSADATTEQMRSAVLKMFPDAYNPPSGTYQQRKGGPKENISSDLGTLESGGKLMKREGETDQQFLARAVEAGRHVSQGAIEREHQGNLIKAPITLAAAGLSPLLAGALNAPGATIASLGAGLGGSELGHRVGGYFGHPRIGATLGGLAGGVAGPAAMSKLTTSGWLSNLLGREVAEGPYTPMSQAPYDYKARLADIENQIKEQQAFSAGKGGPSTPLSESPYATQAKERLAAEAEARKPVSLSESPYATRTAEARAFAEGKPGPSSRVSESPYAAQKRTAQRFAEGRPGPSNPLSSSPNRPPAVEGEEGAAGVAGGAPGGATPGGGQDLITRTRALVKPGETPTAADLKRAGDLTQAPIARLRTLAKFGDKLAENEINRRLRNVTLTAAAPIASAIPQLAPDGRVHYAATGTDQLSPMHGFDVTGANIESPSGKKISYFASAGSPKPPKSGVLGEIAYDDKKGHLLAWNGAKWVEADDANRQEIRDKISGERSHLIGEYYKGGHLTKDQVMIFAKQKLIGMKDARSIVNGTKEERAQ